jgi:outer membrane protein
MPRTLRALAPAIVTLALTAAPAVHAENLMDIYRLAQQNDPVFQAAEATYRADTETLRQARASLLPVLQATADRTRTEASQSAPDIAFTAEGEATYYSNEYGISLTQPLFDYPAFKRYSRAKETVARAQLQFETAKQGLLLRSARAYFTVLAANDNLELAQAEKTALARQLDLARARLDVGLGTVTESYEAEARFKSAEASEIDAQNTLADALQGLEELIGQPAPGLNPLAADMPMLPPDPPDIDAWVNEALTNNLTLLTQQRAVAIAAEDVKIQRGGHYPTLDLVANDSHFEQDGSLSGGGALDRDNTSIAVQLTVPLFQGFAVSSRTAEARERLTAAQRTLESSRRATVRDARDAFRSMATQTSLVSALQQAVTASESALEGKVKGFEAGLNSNIEVLDAQRDLYRAKRDYAQSRYDYVLYLFRLEQAAAQLDVGSLERVNQWLQ